MRTINKIILIVVALTSIYSCKKLIDVKAPVTSVNESNVYATDATAISVLTGIYTSMSSASSIFNGGNSLAFYTGLTADEFNLFPSVSVTNERYYHYTNSLFSNASGTQGTRFWAPLYNHVFNCNAAIEGLSTSTALTPSVKQQLLGEAKFMRAFFYFYLTNLYGDLPLVLNTDWQSNVSLHRTGSAQIYEQIIIDLKDAQGLLSVDYLNGSLQKYSGTFERVRPTKWAATALLGRAYLYAGNNWANAEAEATMLINSSLFSLATLNNTFLKNSIETIWQIQPINSEWNTEEARLFMLNTAPSGLNSSHPVALNTSLTSSFEIGDNRKTSWVNTYTDASGSYYFPYKYKSATQNAPLTEYLMILRLGEQYLIRAEARAKQNNLSGAIADIDVIRQRAGLPLIANTNPGISQTALLTAILHERQVELFTELGHRWFDLKRTGNIDNVMNVVTPQKGGVWSSHQQLYPIPFADIQRNPNLTQNTGY